MAPQRAKNRQTKLAFSPNTSTSKYANVAYEGSPAKKRKVGQQKLEDMMRSDGPPSSSIAVAGPPTPLRSSQPAEAFTKVYDGDEEPEEDGRHLTDTDSEDSLVAKPNKSRRSAREPTTTSIFTRAPIISPKPKEKPKPLSIRDQTQKNDKRNGRKPKEVLEDEDDDDEDTEDDEIVVHSHQLPSRRGNSDGRPSKQTKAARKDPVQIISSGEDESIDAEEGDGKAEEGEEEQDDIEPVTPRRRLVRRSSVAAPDSDEENEDVGLVSSRKPPQIIESDSDSDVVASSRKRQSVHTSSSAISPKKSKANPFELGSEESNRDEDGIPASTHVRKTRLRRRTSGEDSEDAEIAAEANDLKKSTVFKKHKGGRLRDRAGNSKVNDRRSRLEQLKAQREGKAVDISDDEDEDEGDREEEETEQFDADEDEEDDWLVDDDDEARERDEAGDSADMLPLEMMRHGQRGLKEHFMYVVKGIITQRLNPAEASEITELYEMSLKRVNREASGLVDRLVSTSWVPAFVRVLKARPEYFEEDLGGIEIDLMGGKCGACNRSGHPPRFIVCLKGKAYRKADLDRLKDGDEDADDADDTSEDEEGHKLVDEDRSWHLGTFCRSNALNAHSIIHWRHHLNDWLMGYMRQAEYFTQEAIVKREPWSRKKRAKLVDEIMDDLERSRQIKSLWNDFKAKLNAASDIQGQRWGR